METLQPKLRFPGFNDNWEEIKLENFSKSISSGKSKARETDGDFCLYGSTGIIGYTNENDYSGKCILVARVGANAGNLYKVDGEYSVTDNTLMLFTNENNYFDFTYYLLINAELNKLVFGSGQPLITGGQLKNLDLFVPKIQEQTKIANFLSSVDEKLNLLKEKKSLLEDYKKGIMQKIFNQEIRFKDDNGNNFEDWVEKSLGNIAEVNKGNQLNKDDLNDFDVYPSISGGIEPSGYTDKFNRNENTIIISEGGNSCGYVNFIKTKFWCGGHCYSIDILETDNFDNDYLYQLLKFNQNEIMALRVGSGLPNIQKKDLKNFLLKLSINKIEQTKISNFLSAIDQKIELVSNQILDTQEYKRGLLQQMFI